MAHRKFKGKKLFHTDVLSGSTSFFIGTVKDGKVKMFFVNRRTEIMHQYMTYHWSANKAYRPFGDSSLRSTGTEAEAELVSHKKAVARKMC